MVHVFVLYVHVYFIRWIMHTVCVLSPFATIWYQSVLPISFKVTSLALGQSYDCPSASEVTLKNMDKLVTYESPGSNDIIRSKQANPWWRHQMETLSALLALCVGNSPATGELPSQKPVTRSFDIFFDLSLNKRLIKKSRRRWLETPSRSLSRHYNANIVDNSWDVLCVCTACKAYTPGCCCRLLMNQSSHNHIAIFLWLIMFVMTSAFHAVQFSHVYT